MNIRRTLSKYIKIIHSQHISSATEQVSSQKTSGLNFDSSKTCGQNFSAKSANLRLINFLLIILSVYEMIKFGKIKNK